MGVMGPLPLLVTLAAVITLAGPSVATDSPLETASALLQTLETEHLETGILYDRVVPLSGIGRYDGSPASPTATLGIWRQIHHELWRAASVTPSWPTLAEMTDLGKRIHSEGVIPLALIDLPYERLASDAVDRGEVAFGNGRLTVTREGLVQERVVAFTALAPHTFRGESVMFRLDPELVVSDGAAPLRTEIDFDDGAGFVQLNLGQAHRVRYDTVGTRIIHLRMTTADGTRLEARTNLLVQRLQAPAPDDTLAITATVPYLGEFGQGEAYVYLAEEHTQLTDPVIVVEGFDLDNSMGWDELYDLLNREELVETARAAGFDLVVLNFADAIDYLQRNAYVVAELIEQVTATIEPDANVAVVGASMGGLLARFALSHMETQGVDHRARLFLSFDSPQNGASIPLGLQYWLWFFAGQSADAEAWLEALDSPGARQMLVYHHTDPPETVPSADGLRDEFLLDLTAVGDFPLDPRTVAVVNGSGTGLDQGFPAGEQILEWEYTSPLIDITGNVWAVPDGGSQLIFHGIVDVIILPEDEIQVTIQGTRPFDSGPGGYRATMAQIDAAEAPYGDIVALHDNHAFIPTVSALALDTEDLFYDIANDPDLLSHTPFAAVYFPVENQEHVAITPENVVWILAEIGVESVAVGTDPGPVSALRLGSPRPNPFRTLTSMEIDLPGAGWVRVSVFDVGGRRVSRILDGPLEAGPHRVRWDGTDASGARVGAGVYFLRLTTDGVTASSKVVLD